MSLQEYCRYLGWDAAELSRQADLNPRTARKALAGESITTRVARAIAEALTEAMGKTVNVGDIEGLNIK